LATVDGLAAEGDALGADVEAQEDGVADDAGVLALGHAESGVEVQILGAAGHLVAGVEVQQHPVRAAAGVRLDAQPVELDVDAAVAERRVGRDGTGVADGQWPLAGRGGRQVAERVGRVQPGRGLAVAERPPPGTAAEGGPLRRAMEQRRLQVGGEAGVADST
jgi:hypothetical protein